MVKCCCECVCAVLGCDAGDFGLFFCWGDSLGCRVVEGGSDVCEEGGVDIVSAFSGEWVGGFGGGVLDMELYRNTKA